MNKRDRVKAAVRRELAQREKEPEEVRLLRKENAQLRKKLTAHGAKAQLILDAVAEAIETIELPVVQAPKPPRKTGAKHDKEVPVLHCSDWQWGKITSSYSSAVAARRVKELARKACTIIERRKAFADIREVRLYYGGDMVEGEEIFSGQAHLIDQGVLDQAIGDCAPAMAGLASSLLSVVDKVHVLAVSGNHGRTGPRGGSPHPKTNWDRVSYAMAEALTKQSPDLAKRVTWNVADDFYLVDDVLGHGNLIVHGHQVRGGFGGFPWYGVGKKLTGWIDSVPEEWQSLYLGHFHTPAMGTINARRWYCNGTTESDNEYAREELAACGAPMQRLQFFNRAHGMIADCPIYLTAK